jgi:hypothetical protein
MFIADQAQPIFPSPAGRNVYPNQPIFNTERAADLSSLFVIFGFFVANLFSFILKKPPPAAEGIRCQRNLQLIHYTHVHILLDHIRPT